MFILCSGKMAKKPYIIPYTDIKIYSIEEICYYIYQHIYNITEDFVQSSLISWLQEEAGQEVLASKLKAIMQEESPTLKDIVVTILCSADYYQEEDIRKLVKVMDSISDLPIYEREKIKADNYLKYGQYGNAAAAYRSLLEGPEAAQFTQQECGDIWHNQGIAHFYVASFSEAAKDFKEAYAANNKRESLEHYLYVRLMESEDHFVSEAIHFGLTPDEIREMKRKYANCEVSSFVEEVSGGFVKECKEQLRKAFSL